MRIQGSKALKQGFSSLGESDANLALVFAATVPIAGFANLVAFKKQYLRTTFTGINFGW
jgi:hypothetical protein